MRMAAGAAAVQRADDGLGDPDCIAANAEATSCATPGGKPECTPAAA